MTRWAVRLAGLAVVVASVLGGVFWASRDGGPSDREHDAEAVLRTYLTALADGDYRRAAVLLVGGGEALAERDDLAALGLDELSADAVAQSLETYCAPGCVQPTDVSVGGVGDDGSVRLTASFGEPRGHPVSRPFVVGEDDDGAAYVRGLPPPDLSPIPQLRRPGR